MSLNNKIKWILAAAFGWCVGSSFAFPPDTSKVSPPVAVKFNIDSINGIVEDASGMRAGLLYDINLQKVVWQKDMDYAYPVASLTKMMVALLAMEDIKAGKATWDDKVTVDHIKVKKVKRKRVRYNTQETFTLSELIHMAMIASNNAATVWIGTYLEKGNLNAFIQRMNNRARDMGMNNTFYSNPSGLPAESDELDNSSSPNDLLILAIELLKHPEILEITAKGYARVSHMGELRNHNGMVREYPNEVDGLKTGYTKSARFCIVTTADRDGQRLISIVLGAKSPYARNEIVETMMNNYFRVLDCGILGNKCYDPEAKLQYDIANSFPASHLIDSAENSFIYKTITAREKEIHVVRSGETLYKIAKKNGVYVNDIRKWNRLKSTRVIKGQKLVIWHQVKKSIPVKRDEADTASFKEEQPVTKEQEKKTAVAKTKKQKTKSAVYEKPKYVYHIVQPGDTLWNIAQQYKGVTVEGIKKTNKITDNNIKPGTKLKIVISG